LLIDVSVTVSPIKDAAGKAIGVSKVARDISGRKRAEEARRASEERYRTLFEYAPDGIVIADSESYYIDANSSMCLMLGYTHEELIGLHASDIVVQSEIQQIGPALNVIKGKSDYQREWQFRRKNGSVFSADVSATMTPDGNLLGVIRDITEQKRAQEQIAEQAALLEKTRDAILVRDLEGKILFWNSGAERIYGWTARKRLAGILANFSTPIPRCSKKLMGSPSARANGTVNSSTSPGIIARSASRPAGRSFETRKGVPNRCLGSIPTLRRRRRLKPSLCDPNAWTALALWPAASHMTSTTF
jgi:PAS domain S-box-containing protein